MSQVPDRATAAAVQACLTRSAAPWRTVAAGEWGLRAEAAGWPLDIGLALRGGLLRAQAQVLAPGVADPHALLHRNRRAELARLTHTSDGTVWVQGEIPATTPPLEADIDRLLGALVALADDVRAAAAD